jgi:uroporphyrinogen decarboxylase
MADVCAEIWRDFLENFSGAYCVLRFGDDLGFNTNTLLNPDDIRAHILPAYTRIIKLVHDNGKPFLLHCCGKTFSIMDDIIACGIDAKHSNQDVICPLSYWVDTYGKRIALFGGVDTDNLVREDKQTIAQMTRDACSYTASKCGFAIGSGNSIPDWIPPEKYLAMNRAAREWRKPS